ncbi:MAG: ABC transporter substrate-binding protein [Flavobacteriaceae bacterium]|jgi:iron complex transport system substrate-binding protein|nr:ABC transporter substrate-binding protein [Flavobacteriaceae bacterium]
MKLNFLYSFAILSLLFLFGCKQNDVKESTKISAVANNVKYAKGLELYNFKGFTVMKVTKPWPEATKEFTYILKEKNGIIPDSLKEFPVISVPIQSIVVTSTTHIPALEMLGVESTLIGFPSTNFISSTKTRKRIDKGKVREVGINENLNTEVLIDMKPNVIVTFGINNNNSTIDNLKKSGLNVLINGDWTEQSPLGKAEWIKFFGALYNLDTKANSLFASIETNYNKAMALANETSTKPTVLSGAIYQDQWYVPQGQSWASLFLRDAKANYLWKETKGFGSLSLPFEKVFEIGQNAEFWIAPGDFTSLKQMSDSNSHYSKFASFKNKKVYSYAVNKGAKGGIVYFELASTRPDLVLKDLIKIFHSELLPKYNLFFFKKLE